MHMTWSPSKRINSTNNTANYWFIGETESNKTLSTMKVLLTGATGYIGKRLLPVLVNQGYRVVCCVRDKNRFAPPEPMLGQIEVVEVDFRRGAPPPALPITGA